MIMFYHGYQSSSQTNKFTQIKRYDKKCQTVNYDFLSYAEINALYSEQIESSKPEMLVGHSLGAYWALKMSAKYEIPAVIINPAIFPEKSLPHLAYPNISENELKNRVPKYVYIETSDEIIEVSKTIKMLKDVSYLKCHEGGHHRVENMDNVNELIDYAFNTYFVDCEL